MWLITVISWFNRRGEFIFHIGPGILFDDLNLLFVTYAKKKEKQEGGKNLFTALYIQYDNTTAGVISWKNRTGAYKGLVLNRSEYFKVE